MYGRLASQRARMNQKPKISMGPAISRSRGLFPNSRGWPLLRLTSYRRTVLVHGCLGGYYYSTDPVQGYSIGVHGGGQWLVGHAGWAIIPKSELRKDNHGLRFELPMVACRTCRVGNHHSQVGATQGQSWP